MDRDELERVVGDPNIILGIHHYCDRWCERCPKTSRCSVYAMQGDMPEEAESRDEDNEVFWSRLIEMFAITRELVEEWAEKNGVDINEPPSEEYLAQRDHIDHETKDHPLIQAATAYRQQVRGWYEATEEVFKDKAAEAEQAFDLELPGTDPEAELWELSDILEIILWYHTLIVAKLHRAVRQVVERGVTGMADYSGDSDGSAKIALISIDRSLMAWAALRDHLPQQENAILNFLVQLERLRRGTEAYLPNARVFIRPGLDIGHL